MSDEATKRAEQNLADKMREFQERDDAAWEENADVRAADTARAKEIGHPELDFDDDGQAHNVREHRAIKGVEAKMQEQMQAAEDAEADGLLDAEAGREGTELFAGDETKENTFDPFDITDPDPMF